MGRLKPGVTEAQVETDLKPIFEELQRQNPKDFPQKWRVKMSTFAETFPSGIRETLWILFGAVGLLFLISCVNVSSLLLSKATARAKEVAVRASLGASRFRIIRQLLAEAMLIAITGGLLGVAIAYAGLRGIMAAVPPYTIPDEAEVLINLPVLIFTCAVAIASALLFGIAPALQLANKNLVDPLKESGRGTSGGLRQGFVRNALVVFEVALSLILLVGASLMLRTLFERQSVDVGVPVEEILTMRVPLQDERYPDIARRNAFFSEVLRKVRTTPGIAGAALNSGVHPLGNYNMPVEVPSSTQQDNRAVMVHNTDETYSTLMRLALLQGRLMSEHEVARGAHVALVNQSFVQRYFSGRSPLGQMVRIPRLRTPPVRATDDSVEIIGVLRDSLNRAYTNETVPEIHIPYTITGLAQMLVIRTTGTPMSVVRAVRSQILSVDKDQPVTNVATIESMLNDFIYSRPRFNLLLLTIFAAIGLGLALLGIYGVISTGVAQRTHEIGIRMALGATVGDVLRMVLSSGLRLVGIGVVIGLAGSFVSARVLSREVWNVSTWDPLSFAGVCAVMLITGCIACLWPARTAGRVDPVRALRHE
jgi:putative ABC transport system permease protein